MRSRKKKLVYFKKIPVRVDLEQWQRLDKIRADYHFKSTYEIMQYILGCFLRVADTMPGDDDEEVIRSITGGTTFRVCKTKTKTTTTQGRRNERTETIRRILIWLKNYQTQIICTMYQQTPSRQTNEIGSI